MSENVLNTVRLTLVTRGHEHALERPALIPKTRALPAFPRWQPRTLKSRGIENFLSAHEHSAATAIADS
jgi:hypothetical protein